MFFQDLGAYTRGRSRYHKKYENWERLGECDSDFAKHVDNKCFGLDRYSPDIMKHVRSALVIPPTICPQPPSFSGYRSIANVRALLAAFRSAWEGLVAFISGWKRLGAFGGLWNVWQRLGCLGAFRSVWESWDAAWERMGAFRSVREGLKTFGKFLTRVGTLWVGGGGESMRAKERDEVFGRRWIRQGTGRKGGSENANNGQINLRKWVGGGR